MQYFWYLGAVRFHRFKNFKLHGSVRFTVWFQGLFSIVLNNLLEKIQTIWGKSTKTLQFFPQKCAKKYLRCALRCKKFALSVNGLKNWRFALRFELPHWNPYPRKLNDSWSKLHKLLQKLIKIAKIAKYTIKRNFGKIHPLRYTNAISHIPHS